MTASTRKRPPRAAPRPITAAPDETRRMMTERVEYLFREAAAVRGAGSRPVEEDVLTSSPEEVADIACERLVHAAQSVAPQHARAILRDETLVWRFPMGAAFLRAPLTEEQRADARAVSQLRRDASARERALWCIGSIDAANRLPPRFALDARAVFDAHSRQHVSDYEQREVERWSAAWPPDVAVSRVCELLRATRAPEAEAVADDIRGAVFAGPRFSERFAAVVGPRAGDAETAEQIAARECATVARWAEAFDACGLVVPLHGRDAGPLASALSSASVAPLVEQGRRRAYVRAPNLARVLRSAPRTVTWHAASTILHTLRTWWPPVAVAHIADAVARVDAGQRAARMFALPAAQEARVPFEMMARAETFAADHEAARLRHAPKGSMAARTGRVTWRVSWDGRPQDPAQLAFGWGAEAPTADVFRDILRNLGAEGLRDYVILHRMAAEQGRTGRFRWTWSEHKRATAHEARVRSSSARDDDAKSATLARIASLRRAEPLVEVYSDRGARMWKVIGEAPLVSLVGGVDSPGGDVEGLELVLNPALYRTAAAPTGGRDERFFTQLPEAVLSLPALPFSLAVMLAFRWRYAADDGGVVALPRERLMEYMDAGRWRRGNVAAARRTLDAALLRVAEAFGAGCRFEADGAEGVKAYPGGAWERAVVDRVPPSLPASTATNPRTGAELRAWREARKLSQADAAGVLGVGVATVKRAEGAAAEALPRAFKRANWGAAEG